MPRSIHRFSSTTKTLRVSELRCLRVSRCAYSQIDHGRFALFVRRFNDELASVRPWLECLRAHFSLCFAFQTAIIYQYLSSFTIYTIINLSMGDGAQYSTSTREPIGLPSISTFTPLLNSNNANNGFRDQHRSITVTHFPGPNLFSERKLKQWWSENV